jgi:hypothetical protein
MEENNCEYVSSRGLLKSCDIRSFDPISSVCQLINYDFSDLKHGSVIYVCNSAIPIFANVFLPQIPYKIVLVSGDSDRTCWDDIFFEHEDFITFIEHPKIIHWFSQNCIARHPKMSQIPIGLDYHSMTNGYPAWGPEINPVEQEMLLKKILRRPETKPFWKREVKCYSNFHFSTETRFGYDRKDAIASIPVDLVYYESEYKLREDSWIKQTEYSFVLSPHGNGLDCHRTWEALVLGCIPIVKTSGLDSLYEDLPVLIVDQWTDVTEDLLRRTVAKFKKMEFNYDRLLLSYWVNCIRNKCQNATRIWKFVIIDDMGDAGGCVYQPK